MPPAQISVSRVDVKKYDFRQFPENAFVVVFGTRDSGKSTLSRLFSQLLPTAFTSQHIFMVGTEKMKAFWRAVSHSYWVMDPNIANLQKIVELQQRKIKYCNDNGLAFPEEWKVTVYIDDCGSYEHFLHHPLFDILAANGRQCEMTIVVIIQALNHLKKDNRRNATVFISFGCDDKSDIDRIYKERASKYVQKDFMAAFEGITHDRGALVCQHKQGLQFTHTSYLHIDGHEAIAECELAEALAKRASKGLPPKNFTLLQRLGGEIHQTIAEREYKSPQQTNPVHQDALFALPGQSQQPRQSTLEEAFARARLVETDPEDQEWSEIFESKPVLPCTQPFQKGNTTVHFNHTT